MDLWDVVKLILRRWIVSVPLLLLTVAALVWTGSAVSPKYTAEGNILMLPPTTEISSTDGAERQINPWDTDSLTGAVITLLRNRALHDQLTGEGYLATWEAGRDVQFFSVINIQVTASTPAEAQATVQRLSEVVAHEVSARQQGYGLTEGQLVATVTLGAGENVAIARGNQMRALIVVFAAGLILTVGLTIGYDALLRARADRRGGHAPVAARATTAEPASSLATASTRHTNGHRLEPIRQAVTADGASHANQNRQAGISVSYRAASGVPAARPAEEAPQHSTPGPVLDDSTVVLPLSSIAPGADRGDEDPAGGGAAEHRWR